MPRTADLKLRHFRFRHYHPSALFILVPLAGLLGLTFWGAIQIVLGGDLKGLALAGWILLMVYAAVGQLLYSRVTVGADGLATRGAKKLPTFISWADVEDVSTESIRSQPDWVVAISLRMRDGSVVRIPRPHKALSLRAAIDAALEAYREREPVEVPEALKQDRRQRDGYREAAVPTQLLVRVAEDPGADDDVRVRAARRAAKAGGKAAVEEIVEVMADRQMRKRLKAAIR